MANIIEAAAAQLVDEGWDVGEPTQFEANEVLGAVCMLSARRTNDAGELEHVIGSGSTLLAALADLRWRIDHRRAA